MNDMLHMDIYWQVDSALELLGEWLDETASKHQADSNQMLTTLQKVLEEFDIAEYYEEWIKESWE